MTSGSSSKQTFTFGLGILMLLLYALS